MAPPTYTRLRVTATVSYDVVVCLDEDDIDHSDIPNISKVIEQDLADCVAIRSGWASEHEPGEVVMAACPEGDFDAGAPTAVVDRLSAQMLEVGLDEARVSRYAQGVASQRAF